MIGIFDYGVGNIKSVENALSAIGAEHTRISTDNYPDVEKLIIPGVGAFPTCMSEFNARGLGKILKAHMDRKASVLGICVGHQMLFEHSDEFMGAEGLSIFDGSVKRLDSEVEGFDAPLPNINWLPIQVENKTDMPAWIEAYNDTEFYFLHSFAAQSSSTCSVASAKYMGVEFCAAAAKDTVIGVQFHPEKSGAAGLSFLKSFINAG